MEQFFQLKQHGTTVRTEIMAGFTTFMAMAYILMVNAGMFAELEGQVTYNAVYIATAISAVIGTVLIGLLSNLPLAQASGMGLNAYFVYTVCFGIGLSYANALVLVLADGIIFTLLTITGLRRKILTPFRLPSGWPFRPVSACSSRSWDCRTPAWWWTAPLWWVWLPSTCTPAPPPGAASCPCW